MELRIILPLLHKLGYTSEDIEAKYPVVFQEGRRGRKPEADFVVFGCLPHDRRSSLIVVEAKAPGALNIGSKNQAESYASALRAPFTLITDGLTLQVWQFQPSSESELIFDEELCNLESQMGLLESLLRKDVTLSYSKSLAFKNLFVFAQDFTEFELSELNRTEAYANMIERTLLLDRSPSRIISSKILTDFPLGAIIAAASSCGKTALSYSMFRQALTTRRTSVSRPIPFHVPLEDVAEGETLISFIRARLSAHKPGLTDSSLKYLLRENGAVIFCDAFDRLSIESQDRTVSEINNITRDFPNVQLFVFSRASSKPQLTLSLLTLEFLSKEQQENFVATTRLNTSIFFSSAPEILRRICITPLLLKLALRHLELYHEFPTKINEIFRTWLETTIHSDSRYAHRNTIREQALKIIAVARSNAPVNVARAFQLMKLNEIHSSVMDDLIKCGSLQIEASGSLAFEHEALSDYLHALDISDQSSDVAIQRIKVTNLESDSLFPVILMNLLKTSELQNELWKRILQLDILTYANVLRYQAEASEDLRDANPNTFSFKYLTSIWQGLEETLVYFFPQIERQVRKILAQVDCAELAISGSVSNRGVSYSIIKRDLGNPAVIVADLNQPGLSYSNYVQHFYASASGGRLIGANRLFKSIEQVIDRRLFVGAGTVASERLYGRLRFLRRNGFSWKETDSLTSIRDRLVPNRNQIFSKRHMPFEPFFTVDDVLSEMDVLLSKGQNGVEAWCEGFDQRSRPTSDEYLKFILEEHYRRAQYIYREIVEHNFACVAGEFGFYNVLPVRWQINVVPNALTARGLAMTMIWLPVADWNMAGADITFSETYSFPDGETHWDSVTSMLKMFGRRLKGPLITMGSSILPHFDGSALNGLYDGETSAFREAADLVGTDVKALLKKFPKETRFFH